MTERDLANAMLKAAAQNLVRAQAAPQDGVPVHDSALATKNYSQAALAQVQAWITIARANNPQSSHVR